MSTIAQSAATVSWFNKAVFLVRNVFPVVSGLHKEIPTSSHFGALYARGITVGVGRGSLFQHIQSKTLSARKRFLDPAFYCPNIPFRRKPHRVMCFYAITLLATCRSQQFLLKPKEPLMQRIRGACSRSGSSGLRVRMAKATPAE